MKVIISPDGEMRGLESSLTRLMRLGKRRRASRIEPVNPCLRWMFHFIRKRVNDRSRWAEFTRQWPCRWRARIFDGPVLGPFESRQDAINAEIQFITERLQNESRTHN